jgi:hypothetical protein
MKLRQILTITLSVILTLPGCSSMPRIKVTNSPGKVVLDVQTLSEYPTTVRRVRLTDNAGQTVWEIRTKQGTPQLHALAFVAGANSVNLASSDSGKYEIVAPKNGSQFYLKAGTEYTVQIWGNSETGGFAHATFRLQYNDPCGPE